jgi:hypothetical protein
MADPIGDLLVPCQAGHINKGVAIGGHACRSNLNIHRDLATGNTASRTRT